MMTVEDPVCRNTIPLENAHASQEHGGWAYFFCSSRCHTDFKLNPERYADARIPAAFSAPSDASHPSRKA